MDPLRVAGSRGGGVDGAREGSHGSLLVRGGGDDRRYGGGIPSIHACHASNGRAGRVCRATGGAHRLVARRRTRQPVIHTMWAAERGERVQRALDLERT
eukprot:3514276-Prymnesium_polylepis.1